MNTLLENFASIKPVSRARENELRAKIDTRTKPPGSLGRLEEIALRLGLLQDTAAPRVEKPALVVFAGDHGITEEGVSPYPSEVTPQMVLNFLNGGAAINVFARQNNMQLTVVDAGMARPIQAEIQPAPGTAFLPLGIAPGTRNFAREDALTQEQVRQCLQSAEKIIADIHARGSNTIALGEMGIGNTSSAAMLQALFTKRNPADCAGRGTGLDDEGLRRKRDVLRRAHERILRDHPELAEDPRNADGAFALSALRACGGLEIAMMTGAMLAGAARGMLIIVDGFISTSALLAAHRLAPNILDYCLFAHCSGEQGHRAMLEFLGVQPLLDLGLRLGEGTGAALALPLVHASVNFLNEMASFESAGVSDAD